MYLENSCDTILFDLKNYKINKRAWTEMKETHTFSNRDIWKLLLPLMVEQLLTSLMGMADTVMVSNVGSEAISAVSLVDSINVLVIQALSALAAG